MRVVEPNISCDRVEAQMFEATLGDEERNALENARVSAESTGYSLIDENVLATEDRCKLLAEFLPLIDDMPNEFEDDKGIRKRYMTYVHYYKPNDSKDFLGYFVKPQYDAAFRTALYKYRLPVKDNPEQKGRVRRFAPVPDKALKHRFFSEMMEVGFYAVPLPARFRSMPMEVEALFIRYEPRYGVPAVGTPPTPHQDNDWAFCVFLLERRNVIGPLNAFVNLTSANKDYKAVPDSDKYREVELTEPLQGYCVQDRKVAHYVGPVTQLDPTSSGRRTIMILSYKPLVPLRPADINETAQMLKEEAGVLDDQDKPGEIDSLATSEEDVPEGEEGDSEAKPVVLKLSLY
jgi:hypothetical protein